MASWDWARIGMNINQQRFTVFVFYLALFYFSGHIPQPTGSGQGQYVSRLCQEKKKQKKVLYLFSPVQLYTAFPVLFLVYIVVGCDVF